MIDASLLEQVREAIDASIAVIVATPTAASQRVSTLPGADASGAIAAGARDAANGSPRAWPCWETWRDLHPRHAGAPMRPRGIVPYTSGTTGRPKGVRRFAPPPERVAWQAEQTARLFRIVFGLDAASRALLAAPLYHSAPASYLTNASQVGCTLYLQPRFDAEGTLALIERERITHAYLVPTMFQRLLRLAPEVRARYDVSSIRYVTSTGSPCPPEVKRAMIDWWGPVINECYASSETGYATFIDARDWLRSPRVGGQGAGRRHGARAGRRRCTDGAGRGRARSTCASPPIRTSATSTTTRRARASERDGLVTVGDMGRLDAEGYLYITDRKSDMVISGGVNIYPAEIEAALHAMPEVADCAVFGIPDEEFGEALAAAVQLREGCQADRRRGARFPACAHRGLQGAARGRVPRATAARGHRQDLQEEAARPLLAGRGAQDLRRCDGAPAVAPVHSPAAMPACVQSFSRSGGRRPAARARSRRTRCLDATAIDRVRAARVEVAPGRRVDRGGHVALEHDALALHSGVRDRHRREQRLGVGVLRRRRRGRARRRSRRSGPGTSPRRGR